jgi:adenylate kinase family enzyme
MIGPLIVKRLQKEDCKAKGWVLEGFPMTTEQADYLAKAGIEPNKYYLD